MAIVQEIIDLNIDKRPLSFKLVDSQNIKDWENLLGFEIKTGEVTCMRDFYEKHATEIELIQFSAALRKN